MHISFSPQRRDEPLALSRSGPASLSINGDVLDLSEIPSGSTIEDAGGLHPMLAGNIEMTGTGPHVTVILPHGPAPSPAVACPVDIVDPPLGEIALPDEQQEG